MGWVKKRQGFAQLGCRSTTAFGIDCREEEQIASLDKNPRIRSLLFVCTGNTCRSVMAQALARRELGNDIDIQSAGIRPQSPEDAKNAIESLRCDFAIEVTKHNPRDVRSVKLEAFDYVIALDKEVARSLKKVTSRDDLIVWDIEDPWSDDPILYKRCGLQILAKLKTFAIGTSSR